jgi:TM2 domain-containing membrane protein YozV
MSTFSAVSNLENTMKIKMRNIICIVIIALLLNKPLFSDLICQNLYYYNNLKSKLVKNVTTDVSSKTIHRKKSPLIALGIAFFPGVIIHGAGYFYAGKPKTGSLLLVGELVGVGCIAAGIVVISLGVFTKVGTLGAADVTEESSGLASGLMYVGSGLFLGTWVYDVIFAPISCLRYSEQKNDYKINLVKLTLKF